MSKIVDEVVAANAAYAEGFGAKGDLAAPPARGFLILTCMDARLDPAKFAGLVEGDAHVLRNGGGRATDDAIRSMIISHKLLGTREWFIIQHTECGMQTSEGKRLAAFLEESSERAGKADAELQNVCVDCDSTDRHSKKELAFDDLKKSVVDDVTRVRNHPLVNPEIPIYGYIYDVKTGKLIEVEEATAAGRPAA